MAIFQRARSNWQKVLMVSTLLCATQSALATPKDTNSNKRKFRDPAPNLEDHAAYFTGKYGQKFEASREKKADALRLKTIESIKGILADSKLDDFRKFELYLRLGELYVERHDFLRYVEIEDYNIAYEKWELGGKKGPAPQLNNHSSRAHLLEAANTFRNLSTLYPKHPRLDSILFSLARNLSRLGNDNAVLYYDKLLKNYPNSPLVPETHLALGEHYFEKNIMSSALEQYKKAITYKDSEVYPYAIYKLGWAYFNAQYKNPTEYSENLKKTVAAFKLVVKLAQTQSEKFKNVVLLKDEAINDLIVVWAEAEDIVSAWTYFRSMGNEESFYTMLDRLARIYIDQGQNTKAITVLERILKEAPSRLLNLENQLMLVELYDAAGDLPRVSSHFSKLAKNYTEDSVWGKANKAKSPEAIAEANEKIPRSMHRHAAIYHNNGLKTGKTVILNTALDLYALLLEDFPKYPGNVEIRFNFAELNMYMKKYDIAAREYVKVSRTDMRDGKWAKTSALNAIAAVNKIIEGKKYEKLPPPGEVAQQMNIPLEKVRLIEVVDNYVELYPSEPNIPELRAVCAHIQFMYGHYTKAVERYEAIITLKPQTKEAREATKIVINYLAKRQEWDKVIAATDLMMKNTALMSDPKTKEFALQSLKNAHFNKGLALEKSGKNKDAAENFVTYEKLFPGDEYADKAIFNAALNYFKVGELKLATGNLEHLLKSYPKSKLKAESQVKLGESYEALTEYKVAASTYLTFAKENPREARADKAAFNAGVLAMGMEDYGMANEAFTYFGTHFKNSKLLDDVLAKQMETQIKLGLQKEAVRTGQLALTRQKDKESEFSLSLRSEIAQIIFESISQKNGLNEMNALRKSLLKTKFEASTARFNVAQFFLSQSEPKVKKFITPSLTYSAIEAKLTEKQKNLQALANELTKVIEIGSAEQIVASFYLLGEAHEHLADELFLVQPPTGTSAKDVNDFKSATEKLAFPLKEDAQKFYEEAYKRSKEVASFSVWTEKSYNKMTALDRVKYPSSHTLAASPQYMTHVLSTQGGNISPVLD